MIAKVFRWSPVKSNFLETCCKDDSSKEICLILDIKIRSQKGSERIWNFWTTPSYPKWWQSTAASSHSQRAWHDWVQSYRIGPQQHGFVTSRSCFGIHAHYFRMSRSWEKQCSALCLIALNSNSIFSYQSWAEIIKFSRNIYVRHFSEEKESSKAETPVDSDTLEPAVSKSTVEQLHDYRSSCIKARTHQRMFWIE